MWRFIQTYHFPYCVLYDLGFRRLGCLGCPLASTKNREKEFARYPQYARAYIRAFDRMVEARRAAGKSKGSICGFLASDEDLETLFCNLWHGQFGRKPEKQKGKQKPETELGENLQELFDRRNEWYLRGCPEDRETDRVYLNRLRLAIKGLVERIEETLEETQYPECYYSPIAAGNCRGLYGGYGQPDEKCREGFGGGNQPESVSPYEAGTAAGGTSGRAGKIQKDGFRERE